MSVRLNHRGQMREQGTLYPTTLGSYRRKGDWRLTKPWDCLRRFYPKVANG